MSRSGGDGVDDGGGDGGDDGGGGLVNDDDGGEGENVIIGQTVLSGLGWAARILDSRPEQLYLILIRQLFSS